jgi:hypothetical protein
MSVTISTWSRYRQPSSAANYGGALLLAFVFSVGTWRLYISPNNFRSATSHGNHEVRIRLDGADVRIRDEFWGPVRAGRERRVMVRIDRLPPELVPREAYVRDLAGRQALNAEEAKR